MFFATRHSLHSSSQPVTACFDLSQLIITYHNPQRFIAVRVIVYPLLILTYKFTKIKGFSKKFLKLSKAAVLTLPNRIIKHFLSYTKPTATGNPIAVGCDIKAYLSVAALTLAYSLNSVALPVFLNDFILKE